MRHSPSFTPLALLLAALLGSAALVGTAIATDRYSLRMQIAREGGHSLDFAMPWDFVRGSSPFDFVDGSNDRRGLQRLRAAWEMLSSMSDDRTVVIHADGERTRVWKHGGSLVLEPLDDDANVRIRIPSGIVEAVLRHDGRLRTSDIDALLRRRGETELVDIVSEEARVHVCIDRERDAD